MPCIFQIMHNSRNDALFTIGYLLQLGCVRLYDRFKEVLSCQQLCKDLLALRAEIAGKDEICYYISPEDVLKAGRGESWSLERFDSSARFVSLRRPAAKAGCLVM